MCPGYHFECGDTAVNNTKQGKAVRSFCFTPELEPQLTNLIYQLDFSQLQLLHRQNGNNNAFLVTLWEDQMGFNVVKLKVI